MAADHEHESSIGLRDDTVAPEKTACPAPSAYDTDDALVVIDNLPAGLPIGVAELEAIETYLADVLDAVLGGETAPITTSPRHKAMRR